MVYVVVRPILGEWAERATAFCRRLAYLGQANLDVAVHMHLTTDIHIMLGVSEGHHEGRQCLRLLRVHIHPHS